MLSLTRIEPVAAATIALAILTCAIASAAEHGERAKVLHKLNPAGNLGGESIIGTQPGQHLKGVEGKPNFMIALADGITIHGASANDELGVGAHANDVRILAPESGHSLIVGGPGSTIVVGGKGSNHVVSHGKGAKIVLKSPHDEVVANGRETKIVCTEDASHELIKVDEDVEVSEECRGRDGTIKIIGEGHEAAKRPRRTTRAAAITGAGTNENPYTAQTCNASVGVGCQLKFPPRTLTGLWANEYVPAYRCPKEDPWLMDTEHAPFGTHLPDGVEVLGLGPVGVSISRILTVPDYASISTVGKPAGTETGAGASSATNWTIGTVSYQVVLHCTRNRVWT
jgi:hypothetical protein